MGGRVAQEEGDMCILIADSCCYMWQKPTQHYSPNKNKFFLESHLNWIPILFERKGLHPLNIRRLTLCVCVFICVEFSKIIQPVINNINMLIEAMIYRGLKYSNKRYETYKETGKEGLYAGK